MGKVAGVSLKHTIWDDGEKQVYFYDGELTAKDGVVTIPADKPEWIRRAWVLGYQLDPKTKKQTRLENLIPEEFEVGE
jgi:hypothetical protein